MSEFKLTTVEEFEAATARLLETGAKVGADAWQIRAKNQTPHCKFGERQFPLRAAHVSGSGADQHRENAAEYIR